MRWSSGTLPVTKSARPIIGTLNKNKVRLKVAFFQPAILRAMRRDWLVEGESGEKDDRCDLYHRSPGSELAS